MKTLLKLLCATGLAASLATTAEAKVLASTFYAPAQASDAPIFLLLKTGSNSKFFTLSAKAKVSISVSANCAVTVNSAPGSSYALKLRIMVDGTNVSQTADYVFCSGNGTAPLDGPVAAALTIARTLKAGQHSIQIQAVPYSALTLPTDFFISNVSLVVQR